MGFLRVSSNKERYWYINTNHIVKFAKKGEGTRIWLNEYDGQDGTFENVFIDVQETVQELISRIRREA